MLLVMGGILPSEYTLVSEYYDKLDAPYKELIWMENSGHHAMYEEAQLYDSILIEKLLPFMKIHIV